MIQKRPIARRRPRRIRLSTGFKLQPASAVTRYRVLHEIIIILYTWRSTRRLSNPRKSTFGGEKIDGPTSDGEKRITDG